MLGPERVPSGGAECAVTSHHLPVAASARRWCLSAHIRWLLARFSCQGLRRWVMRMNRRRDRSNRAHNDLLPSPAPISATTGRSLVMQVDPFLVQQVDPTRCNIAGCPEVAIPEDWEVVDLDTGDELPMRLCEEHQLAYLRS